MTEYANEKNNKVYLTFITLGKFSKQQISYFS